MTSPATLSGRTVTVGASFIYDLSFSQCQRHRKVLVIFRKIILAGLYRYEPRLHVNGDRRGHGSAEYPAAFRCTLCVDQLRCGFKISGRSDGFYLEQGRLVGRPQVRNRGGPMLASPALATESISPLAVAGDCCAAGFRSAMFCRPIGSSR
jgi:hypothetical protein